MSKGVKIGLGVAAGAVVIVLLSKMILPVVGGIAILGAVAYGGYRLGKGL